MRSTISWTSKEKADADMYQWDHDTQQLIATSNPEWERMEDLEFDYLDDLPLVEIEATPSTTCSAVSTLTPGTDPHNHNPDDQPPQGGTMAPGPDEKKKPRTKQTMTNNKSRPTDTQSVVTALSTSKSVASMYDGESVITSISVPIYSQESVKETFIYLNKESSTHNFFKRLKQQRLCVPQKERNPDATSMDATEVEARAVLEKFIKKKKFIDKFIYCLKQQRIKSTSDTSTLTTMASSGSTHTSNLKPAPSYLDAVKAGAHPRTGRFGGT